eukprot:387768_1
MGNFSNGNRLEDEPNFSDYYTTGKRIANGTFATVKMCKRRADNKRFAVKIINKNELKVHELEQLKEEVSILGFLSTKSHPNIIKMNQVFEDRNKIKLILELCQNNTLLDELYDAPNQRFTESKAAEITHTIATALQFLHSNHIVHRDLKPDNILFSKNGTLKITDFGTSKHIQFANQPEGDNITCNYKMKTKVGTPYYVAPELIIDENNWYDNSIDLWSLGVILYMMLAGFRPFSSRKGLCKMYSKIINGKYSFKNSVWDNISDDAIDLIKKLLTVNPEERINCEELLKHKW